MINTKGLEWRWGTSVEKSAKTLNVTTQSIIRTTLDTTLSRQFRTNNRHLRHQRSPQDIFTYMMQSDIRSLSGNLYAQIYCTNKGWFRAYPSFSKSQYHETISLLFTYIGVSTTIIMDKKLEKSQGQTKNNAHQASCYIYVCVCSGLWSASCLTIIGFFNILMVVFQHIFNGWNPTYPREVSVDS